MRSDFAVFILSHGRPDNIVTLSTLKRAGYTGSWYIVIDDEDSAADEYFRRYSNHVLMFSKAEIEKITDLANNKPDYRAVIYARNACFDLAEELGYEYFLQLDDDYTYLGLRYARAGELKTKMITDADKYFEAMVEYLGSINALTIAFAQGGDFIGGYHGTFLRKRELSRKAMNTFFCKTSRRFSFVGNINEDVNSYISYGQRGELMLTIPSIYICQLQTQTNPGGMSGLYLTEGTFLKSFYSVLYNPSCVKLALMGNKFMRIHHNILWNNAVPKILDEKHRKKAS